MILFNTFHITGASHVYKVDRHTGGLIKIIAQPGRKPGTFNEPSGITCDRDGNVLIGDSRSNRIQVCYLLTMKFCLSDPIFGKLSI